MSKLPRYNISIDPELSQDGEKLGMTQIAYTATPAILTRGIAFNSNLKKEMYFTDSLKYRLAAPILIPDLPIYRQDDEMGEYEVVFTKEVIEMLYEDFMLNKGKAAFNLDHKSDLEAPSFILESWITGPSESDPSFTKYGIEVPEGSVFVVSQFTDKDYFKKEIIEKDRLGYSIEGFLGLTLDKITNKIKQNKMTKQKFEMAKLEDGTPIWISALEVGGDVYTIDENMEKAPLFDGEHILASGETVVTVNGKITEIKPKAEEAPVEAAKVEEEKPKEEETKMAEPAPTETPAETPAEAPVAEAQVDEAAIMAIVQPKLDELYKVIAEIKTLIEADSVEDSTEDTVDTEMKDNKAQVALASFFKILND